MVQKFGLIQSKIYSSVFYSRHLDKNIYLVVYVDNIVITRDDSERILRLKT